MKLLLAAFLCFTTWMSVVHATHGPMPGCCPGRSNTTVPLKRILNYTNQTEGACRITAIVFLTKVGKRICSDPNSDWAKKAILKVDAEKRKKKALQEKGHEGNEEGSTSDITPAVTTTSTSAPQKKCRNRRRRRV